MEINRGEVVHREKVYDGPAGTNLGDFQSNRRVEPKLVHLEKYGVHRLGPTHKGKIFRWILASSTQK